MKAEVKRTPWAYQVHVSKDSPRNIRRGSFDELPDTEYHRGYYHPVCYTSPKEAKKALAYFEKGFIEKSRTVMKRDEYAGDIVEREVKIMDESNRVKTTYKKLL
jgi:hypothetical protein